jgi:hypothetical protein
MHPTQASITKDFVKVHIHIIPKTEHSFFFLPKMEDAKFYVYLNQEALRLKKSPPEDKVNSTFLDFLKQCTSTTGGT